MDKITVDNRSTIDKVEHIGLLAVHGAWDYIKNDPKEIAVKAAEGLAIGVAIATAPAWIGVAAGVAGVGLLGKEIYDKGKQILPAVELVWSDSSNSAEVKKAEDVIAKQVGSTLVDSTVMLGVGFGANKIAGAISGTVRGAAGGLSHEQMDNIMSAASRRMHELSGEYGAQMRAREAAGEFAGANRRPGGHMAQTEPLGLIRGLDALDPEVGKHFSGHGIAKGSWREQIGVLQDILTRGIDPAKKFYEMPLRGAEKYGGAFGADRPFDTGIFILLSEGGARGGITNNGVKYVLVNDPLYGAMPQLQAAYPKVTFIRAEDIPTRLPQILKERAPKLHAEALADITANARAAAEGAARRPAGTPEPAPKATTRQTPQSVEAKPFVPTGDPAHDW